ncbi:hypothetical protein FRC11_013957, partial [Ceratobasidium sp. 423]
GALKGYLSYVVKHVHDEKLAENLTDKEIDLYVKAAQVVHTANKELRAVGMSHKRAVSQAFEELQTIYQCLVTLNQTVGIEFVLFMTCGALEDDAKPFYVKAAKDAEVDTSKFHHVKYKQYAKLVLKYKVILHGYPDSRWCNDWKLTSGDWGFKKIETTKYDKWKTHYKQAEENGEPMPALPHIEVPGSEYKNMEKSSSTMTKFKATDKPTKKKASKHPAKAPGKKGNMVKSCEIINDDSDSLGPTLHDSDILHHTEEETNGSSDND